MSQCKIEDFSPKKDTFLNFIFLRIFWTLMRLQLQVSTSLSLLGEHRLELTCY